MRVLLAPRHLGATFFVGCRGGDQPSTTVYPSHQHCPSLLSRAHLPLNPFLFVTSCKFTMCSADSVRAERDKGLEIGVAAVSAIFLATKEKVTADVLVLHAIEEFECRGGEPVWRP